MEFLWSKTHNISVLCQVHGGKRETERLHFHVLHIYTFQFSDETGYQKEYPRGNQCKITKEFWKLPYVLQTGILLLVDLFQFPMFTIPF